MRGSREKEQDYSVGEFSVRVPLQPYNGRDRRNRGGTETTEQTITSPFPVLRLVSHEKNGGQCVGMIVCPWVCVSGGSVSELWWTR